MNSCSIPLKRGYNAIVEREIDYIVDDVYILGNYSKSGYMATPIISKNGLCPTIRENHGQVIAIVVEDGDITRYKENDNEGKQILNEQL